MKEVRKAVFAGRFYPDTEVEINKLFYHILSKEKSRINYKLSDNKIVGAVIPHAGHIYSGYQSIHFFEILKNSGQIFDSFVILHPIHHGSHTPFATDNCKYWETPLGRTGIDDDLIRLMDLQRLDNFMEHEHSAEVILPFIQRFANSKFQILPIGIAHQNWQNARLLAQNLYESIKKSNKRVCILASSDFTHFESPESGAGKDQFVLEKIMAFDAAGIENEVKSRHLSVCGFAAIMTLIEYFSFMNYKVKANILLRGHSGQIYPSTEVVDYISILFHETNQMKGKTKE